MASSGTQLAIRLHESNEKTDSMGITRIQNLGVYTEQTSGYWIKVLPLDIQDKFQLLKLERHIWRITEMMM